MIVIKQSHKLESKLNFQFIIIINNNYNKQNVTIFLPHLLATNRTYLQGSLANYITLLFSL